MEGCLNFNLCITALTMSLTDSQQELKGIKSYFSSRTQYYHIALFEIALIIYKDD